MAKTVLTPDQFKEAASLGSVSEVRDLAGDGYSFEDIKTILESQRTRVSTDRDTEAARQAAAERQERENEKNDKKHPAISVYSYPEGDVARPRPQFRCPMFWRDVELSRDTLTAVEIELLNQIEPGRYLLERPDGSPLKVDVMTEQDEVTGKLSKLSVQFDKGKGLRNSLPSMVAMMRAMIEQKASALVTA